MRQRLEEAKREAQVELSNANQQISTLTAQQQQNEQVMQHPFPSPGNVAWHHCSPHCVRARLSSRLSCSAAGMAWHGMAWQALAEKSGALTRSEQRCEELVGSAAAAEQQLSSTQAGHLQLVGVLKEAQQQHAEQQAELATAAERLRQAQLQLVEEQARRGPAAAAAAALRGTVGERTEEARQLKCQLSECKDELSTVSEGAAAAKAQLQDALETSRAREQELTLQQRTTAAQLSAATTAKVGEQHDATSAQDTTPSCVG